MFRFLVVLAVLVANCYCRNTLNPLPSVNPDTITVSGISSGGAFATQFHVAFSKTIKGAGIWAGVPNLCFFLQGLSCMTTPSIVSADLLVYETGVLETLIMIDNTDNLRSDKVFIVHGENDETVAPGFAKIIQLYYEHYFDNPDQIGLKLDLPATHCLISDRRGTECGTTNDQVYIEDCAFDSVSAMFNHFYDNIVPHTPDGELSSSLETFSQAEFFPGSASSASMTETGYAYIPKSCQDSSESKEKCHLHVHFHGCTISAAEVGTAYIEASGLLEMADSNNIVLLLPQIEPNILTNPKGCWNWFGYLGDYIAAKYATKSATQMAGIFKMIQRIAGL